MKEERLLRAFGQIDGRYIAEAEPKRKELKMRTQCKNREKGILFLRRPMAAAAALAVCVCIAGTTALAAAGKLEGFFADVFRWDGAVVGTTYEQASDEVALQVKQIADPLVVELEMLEPNTFPYREIERFGIANYQIVEETGKTVAEGSETEMAALAGGRAIVEISLEDLPEGTYKLVVRELVGDKKAEQPLILRGYWECSFTK